MWFVVSVFHLHWACFRTPISFIITESVLEHQQYQIVDAINVKMNIFGVLDAQSALWRWFATSAWAGTWLVVVCGKNIPPWREEHWPFTTSLWMSTVPWKSLWLRLLTTNLVMVPVASTFSIIYWWQVEWETHYTGWCLAELSQPHEDSGIPLPMDGSQDSRRLSLSEWVRLWWLNLLLSMNNSQESWRLLVGGWWDCSWQAYFCPWMTNKTAGSLLEDGEFVANGWESGRLSDVHSPWFWCCSHGTFVQRSGGSCE